MPCLPCPLHEMNERIERCTGCGLSSYTMSDDGSAARRVPGEGPEHADVMIVGEAPGAQEQLTGRPFVGRSGKLLTELLNTAGFHREELFITSVIKCRPPENRNPSKSELLACMPWLEQQIEAIRPRILLTMGNISSQSLLNTRQGIRTIRGAFYTATIGAQTVVLRPMFHPAYLLRNQQRTPGSPWALALEDLFAVHTWLKR